MSVITSQVSAKKGKKKRYQQPNIMLLANIVNQTVPSADGASSLLAGQI